MSGHPTNYLSVEDVSKRFGERLIFEGLTFGVNKGQKVALVAQNGAGKSTLLNILTDKDTSDTGRVVFNNDIKVGFLAQDHGLDEDDTILNNIYTNDNPKVDALLKYEKALSEGVSGEALQKHYDAMDREEAWNYEAKAKAILGKLNLHDMQRVVSSLSGGEKRRIALAKVLIQEPDLLFLDEPTNHLDLDMIEWLEQYLATSNMTLLMVTHDRYFLEVICDEIIELENQQLYRYKGNYSYFLEKKAEREALEFANREKARNLMRSELVWIRSTPKARTTKSKYREGQFKDIKKAAKVRLEKDEMKLELNPHRMGGKTVEFHRVTKAFGEKTILGGFDYHFKRKEAVGIVGRNGTGKSTFLNMLTGSEQPDGGKIVVGDTVVFGYYTQSGLRFKDNQRVIEAVREIADIIPLKGGSKITAAQLLERFLFPRSMHFNLISKLSGGEKKRLHLLRVLMANPNFLILDEPTNDLDIFTLSLLEEYLQDFPGVLLIVSHDRYFMDKLVEHVFVFDGKGGIRDIGGNYTTFRQIMQDEARAEKANKAPVEKIAKANKKKKFGFKEQYEMDQLTEEMEKLEARKKELETAMAAPGLDHEKMLEVSTELGTVMESLSEKEFRWLELSELAED